MKPTPIAFAGMTDLGLPSYNDLHWPLLIAVREIGGSGAIDEIDQAVIEREGFTEEQQAALHKDGPQTALKYRLAWARTYLKGMGLLENSARGIWSLTENGRSASEADLPPLRRDYLKRLRVERGRRQVDATSADDEGDPGPDETWQDELLSLIQLEPPERFEQLSRRVLREAGFINTAVTGRSGDGGIDGVGTYRLSLISFTVFFQCKRYTGSVRAGAVRDFRGAMAGRGDKGLLITTGTFTSDARQEATRDGAPPIDLIDGTALCELLKRFNLGVRTTTREVEEIEVVPGFFAEVDPSRGAAPHGEQAAGGAVDFTG